MSDGCVYVGNVKGEVMRFNKKESDPLRLMPEKGEQGVGQVSCLDVGDVYLVVGYSEGGLCLFHLKKGIQVYWIGNIHTDAVLSVRFLEDITTKDPCQQQELLSTVNLLSSDRNELMKTSFSKGFFKGWVHKVENYPELFEQADMLKRVWNRSKDIQIAKSDKSIFRSVFGMKTQILMVSGKEVYLRVFVTYDAVIGFTESNFSKPMIVYYQTRQERGATAEPNQIATIDVQKEIIVLAWGMHVYVTQLKLSFLQIDQDWCVINTFPKSAKYYSNQTPILHCGFIEYATLFLIDSQNTCHILNYKKFALEPYNYSDLPEQTSLAHIFKSHNIQRITKPMLFPIDSKVFAKSYQHSVQILNKKIYVLSSDNKIAESPMQRGLNQDEVEIQEGEILRWDYQLDLKFESNSKDLKGQFLTFELCLQIYRGSNQSFGDITTFKAELSKYICNKVTEFFERNLMDTINLGLQQEKTAQIKDLNAPTLESIKKVLQNSKIFNSMIEQDVLMKFTKYLVATHNFDYLFNRFSQPIRMIPQLKNNFYASLRPFIELHQIKLIPSQDVYRELLEYYKSRNEIQVIHKLIMTLNLKEQSLDFIINSCTSEIMLTPLIYLSTKTQADFIKPLRRMLTYYQTLPSTRGQDITLTHSYMAYKLFWFIRMTLSGLLFPGEIMEPSRWNKASNSLFQWIFEEGYLTKLLEMDPDLTFQNVLMFFRGRSSQFIFESESTYTDKIRKRLEDLKFTINPRDNLKTLLYRLIKYEMETCKLPQECWEYFYLFLAEIKENDVKIDKDIALNTATFLLENPSAHLFKQKNLLLEFDVKCRQIIKLISPFIGSSENQLDTFLRKAQQSPFIEVCSYIYKIQGDYASAVRVYIESSVLEIRLKVFPFLKDILSLQAESKEVFAKQIISQLPKLVEIDYLKTKELLHTIKIFDIHVILQAIQSNQELVFHILKDYIREQRKLIQDDNIPIPDSDIPLYIQYIRLLCKYHPKKVMRELKTQVYNQDDVLRILKEEDHQQGIAYIYGCIGNIRGALEIHLRQIQEQLSNQMGNQAYREFKIALELLSRSKKRGDEEAENNWFFWITGIQKLEGNVCKEMQSMQNKIEEESFEDLIYHVQIKSILQNKELLPVFCSSASESGNPAKITAKSNETITTLLKSFSFEHKILENARDIIYDEYSKNELLSFHLVVIPSNLYSSSNTTNAILLGG